MSGEKIVSSSFVWDKLVRITHWSVAIIIFANLLVTEGGETTHRYLGYVAVGLIFCRLIWALTKAKSPARFCDLIPRFHGFSEHFLELKQRRLTHLGHNAFGLLAVWAMWLCIIALSVTGWLDDTDWGIMNDIDDWHEGIASFLQAIVFLHISAVLVTGWWTGKNLIRRMIHDTSSQR